MSGQAVGHKVKLMGNIMNTLETVIFALAVKIVVRMLFLMISRPSLNMGHIGFKTRSLRQNEGKYCQNFRGHIFTIIQAMTL